MIADIRQLRIDLAAALRWAARLELHEGICNHFSLARSTGGTLRKIKPAIVEKTAQQIAGEKAQCCRHFDALKRILDREEPDYRH